MVGSTASRCPTAAPKKEKTFSLGHDSRHTDCGHTLEILFSLSLCQHPTIDKSRFDSMCDVNLNTEHPSAGHLFSFYSGVGKPVSNRFFVLFSIFLWTSWISLLSFDLRAAGLSIESEIEQFEWKFMICPDIRTIIIIIIINR